MQLTNIAAAMPSLSLLTHLFITGNGQCGNDLESDQGIINSITR